MKLKIEIDMDGAAFEDSPADEAGRILEKYVERIRFGGGFDEPGEDYRLRDGNGNRVGFARVEE